MSVVDASVDAPTFDVRVRLPLASFVLDVEFESHAKSLGIFGPSGSGKTSLLEALAGWRALGEGRVRLGQRVLFDSQQGIARAVRARDIGYVPQDVLLFPHWSVERNIRCGSARWNSTQRDPFAELHDDQVEHDQRMLREGKSRDEMFSRTVEVLELAALLGRPSTALSGGERQRVALARALCSWPRCLLLDEPMGALDLPLRRRILPYLIRVREAFGLPMLFVSHDATEVQALCDEVAILDRGRVRARGRPDEVLRAHLAREQAYENVLRGVVLASSAGTARVRVAAGVELQVPAGSLANGEHAIIGLGADEILIASTRPVGISARNLLPARVERVEAAGEQAWIDTALLGDGEPSARLTVRVTPAAVRELGLAPGVRVHLVFKTNSCRVLNAMP